MRNRVYWLPVLALFVAAGDARALVTQCVSTPAQLRTALSTFGSTDDLEIRLRTGTYLAGGDRFAGGLHGTRTLTVSGGWDANCTAQTRDPSLTVLDGENLSQVLDIGTFADVTTARANFSNFSVESGMISSSIAAGMSIRLDDGTPTVLIDRLRFRGNIHNGGEGGGLRIMNFTAGTVVVRNSVLMFNSAQQGGGIAVTSSVAGAVTQLVNNTVVGNQAASNANITGGGIVASYTSVSLGSIELRNNAVFGNTAGGAPSDVHAVTNAVGLVGTHNATGVPATGKVTQTGAMVVADPGFAGLDDFRLESDSPLIDAGAPLSDDDAASRDHAYQVRVLGKAPDIGAFESNYVVFRDSFE